MGIHHVDLTTSKSPSPDNESLNLKPKLSIKDLEREEGEIVEDDFEDIISSDEELSMRKRIEELEARNAELEKIANISGLYSYEMPSKKDSNISIERNPLATIELSDIEEYQLEKRQHTSKNYLSKNNRRTNHRIEHNRNRRLSSSPEIITDSVRHRGKKQKSRRRSTSQKKKHIPRKSNIYEDLSSSDNNDTCYLNRDELRLALKRDTTYKETNSSSLNQKLLGNLNKTKDVVESTKNPVNPIQSNENVVENVELDNSDDSISLEEQELRLIALKSAVVKKHLARKKRKEIDEKKPYSPSDFSNIKITPSPKNSENFDSCMDISPVASPELILNDNYENTTLIDMDLENSSDSDVPIFIGQEKWMPIEQAPLQIETNSVIIRSPQPKKPLSSLNDQDFIDTLNKLLPFSNSRPQIVESDDDVEIIETTTNDSGAMKNIEDEEEEAEALRALLLAKMNSPKVHRPTPKEIEPVNNFIDEINNPVHSNKVNSSHENKNKIDNEADNLRDFVLSSMKSNSKNSTALVLKNAVKRLKSCKPEILCEQNENNVKICKENSTKLSVVSEPVIANTNILPVINPPYLTCLNNSMYIGNNLTSLQHPTNLQNMFRLPFYETNFKPIHAPNQNNNSIRTSLKVVPIVQSTCDDSSKENSRKSNKISPNLKEIPLVQIECKKIDKDQNLIENNSPNLASDITESSLINISTTDIRKEQVEINSQPENIKNLSPFENTKEDNKKNEQSLEIEKKIAELRKLTDSIQQTTEISKSTSLITSTNLNKKSPAIPTTSITNKIVKVNKVINKTVLTSSLKRKVAENLLKLQQLPQKQAKKSSSTDDARLITSLEPPTVKKFIITVGDSSTDSEYENFDDYCQVNSFNTDCNNSPISVEIGSPYSNPYASPRSPCIPSDKPTDQHIDSIEMEAKSKSESNCISKSVTNDLFQAKLNEFLKNARTKVDTEKKHDLLTINKKSPSSIAIDSTKTPLAVRHLPESSQLEYRRLISRMKILEKQKQIKEVTKPTSPSSTQLTNFKVTITNNKSNNQKMVQQILQKTIINDVAISNLEKQDLTRKILVKTNVEDTVPSDNIKPKVNTPDENTLKTKRIELLKRYEMAFHKNGNNILDNIDKAMNLVSRGREEKIKQLFLQKRLEKLRKEMDKCELELGIHNEKISKIYPTINNAHKVINNLKTRRLKIAKTTKSLGISVIGENYNISDDKNDEIMQKYKTFLHKIKSLKSVSIEEFENQTPTSTIESHEKFWENLVKILIDQKRDSDKIQKNVNCMETKSALPLSLTNRLNASKKLEHEINVPKDVKSSTNDIDQITPLMYETICDTMRQQFKQEIQQISYCNEYRSPLDHSNRHSTINPLNTICPYQLMGQCDDTSCKYEHL